MAVGERGRLHPDVLAAYNAAHGKGNYDLVVAVEREEEVDIEIEILVERPVQPKAYPKYKTGFCQFPGKDNGHQYCTGRVTNGAQAPRQEVLCDCTCHPR